MPAQQNTDTKTRILEKAEEIILKKSFGTVGLNEILKQAGVPKGSFYHYFESKEDFGVSLIRYAADKYSADLDEILFSGRASARNRLLDFYKFHIDFYARNNYQLQCLVVKLSGEISTVSEPMRKALQETADDWTCKYARIIRQGHEDGSISKKVDADTTPRFLYDSWLGANAQVPILRSASPFQALAKSVEKLVTR